MQPCLPYEVISAVALAENLRSTFVSSALAHSLYRNEINFERILMWRNQTSDDLTLKKLYLSILGFFSVKNVLAQRQTGSKKA